MTMTIQAGDQPYDSTKAICSRCGVLTQATIRLEWNRLVFGYCSNCGQKILAKAAAEGSNKKLSKEQAS